MRIKIQICNFLHGDKMKYITLWIEQTDNIVLLLLHAGIDVLNIKIQYYVFDYVS